MPGCCASSRSAPICALLTGIRFGKLPAFTLVKRKARRNFFKTCMATAFWDLRLGAVAPFTPEAALPGWRLVRASIALFIILPLDRKPRCHWKVSRDAVLVAAPAGHETPIESPPSVKRNKFCTSDDLRPERWAQSYRITASRRCFKGSTSYDAFRVAPAPANLSHRVC